jgi:Xaa-Pro aminopeptidase
MHNEQRQRAHDFLRMHDIQRALFANPYTVTWLTGYAAPLQLGPGPFAGGPPLVWYDADKFTLIVLERSDTTGVDVPVVTYAGNTVETPIRSAENLEQIVHDLIGKGHPGQLGLEHHHLPVFTLPPSAHAYGVAIDGWLDELRMVKTAEELAKLRRSFALTDLAHAVARKSTRVGVREIDVWTAAHCLRQRLCGQLPRGQHRRLATRPGSAPW